MKKFLFIAFLFGSLLSISCSNDDIIIEANDNVNEVNVSVSLSNFFSSYDFNDTRHEITVTDDYRTFNSESGLYIQVRTLIYDGNGELKDSLLSYSTNTNTTTSNLKLSPGNYTIISTLTFALKNSGDDASWWYLKDKEKLATAKLQSRNRFSKWCIMSYDAKKINVTSGQSSSVSMTPSPIGALCYFFLQNFQFKSEATYGTVADNGIRSLCLYSQNIADVFKLDPDASDRYEYLGDAGRDSWYYLSSYMEPTDFDDDWKYFQSNLFDFFYILTPNPHVQFGYVLDGNTGFSGYGEKIYNIQNGKTYLAYWDYFKVGNPYFGIADNSHWNSYSASVRAKGRGGFSPDAE